MYTHRFDDIVNEIQEAREPAGNYAELCDELFARPKPRRRRRKKPAPAQAVLAPTRMSQTEVSLRLAMYLVDQRLTECDIWLALTGNEVTRAGKPRFPVEQFLKDRGFARSDGLPGDWRGRYPRAPLGNGPTCPAALVLHTRLGEGDVVTTLTTGKRFIAEVSAGPVRATRSPTEHRLLRAVIARALTTEFARDDDVLVAVVPRSSRFRELAARWREAPRVVRSGVSILTLDRFGQVDGHPEIAGRGRR